MVHRISVMLVILIMFCDVMAQLKEVSQPHHYVAPFREFPPMIDGSLNDPFWEGVLWSESFQDIEGNRKPLPEYETKVKMAYTSMALYIAATIEDPHIWATLTEKNQPIYKYDKNFEVFIDPDGDHCNYYELELNALNTIWELSLPFPYRNGGKPVNPDNIKGMKSAVHINGTINNPSDIDTSWTVEIEIPFEEMKKYSSDQSTPKSGDIWRINFSRVQWDHLVSDLSYIKYPDKSENNWVWTPQHQVNMHAPENWGFLFFDAVRHSFNIEQEWKIESQLVEYVMNKKFLEDSIHKIKSSSRDTFFILNQEKQHFINKNTCYWKKKIDE